MDTTKKICFQSEYEAKTWSIYRYSDIRLLSTKNDELSRNNLISTQAHVTRHLLASSQKVTQPNKYNLTRKI